MQNIKGINFIENEINKNKPIKKQLNSNTQITTYRREKVPKNNNNKLNGSKQFANPPIKPSNTSSPI